MKPHTILHTQEYDMSVHNTKTKDKYPTKKMSSATPFIAQHPLLAHKMTILRDRTTSATDFRKVISDYTGFVISLVVVIAAEQL